jgi:diguanylate cyclase
MRYKETRDQTAELLRLILPLMARHNAGFHPLSYAVWYEYLANINPRLREAVDARLEGRARLTDQDMVELFNGYVAQWDIESSARMQAGIQQLVEEVQDVAGKAGQEVALFGDELGGYQRQLRGDMDSAALTGVVNSLIDDAGRVRDRTKLFQAHLRKSSQEVERLRGELELVQGLALTDPLTGLLNRRGFDEKARRACAAGLRGHSVLIIDIDHFKAINDTYGHLLGDKVISAVAQVLKRCVEGRGQAARIGGEEFALLLAQGSAAGCAEIAERIRSAVERGRIRRADHGPEGHGAEGHAGSEGDVAAVTVSVGAAAGLDGEDFAALLARADRALYQSKQAGRNRVTISTGT